MRDILLAIVSLAAVVAFVWVGISQKQIPPIELTPRLLDCDADWWDGKAVKIKTDGMEFDSDGSLVYRKRTDLPPCVVCKFKAKPEKIPAVVTGLCLGRQGDAVVVTDCR